MSSLYILWIQWSNEVSDSSRQSLVDYHMKVVGRSSRVVRVLESRSQSTDPGFEP